MLIPTGMTLFLIFKKHILLLCFTYASTYAGRPEDNIGESVLSSEHIGSGDPMQAVRLGGGHVTASTQNSIRPLAITVFLIPLSLTTEATSVSPQSSPVSYNL